MFNGLTVKITDDVKGWLDGIRPYRATYVGGMGSESHNYHVESMAKRGFADDAARIQELFLAGRREEAIAAMPDEALLQGTLVGHARRASAQQWEAGGVVPPGRHRCDRRGRPARRARADRRAHGSARRSA